jgi:hypothetical protein
VRSDRGVSLGIAVKHGDLYPEVVGRRLYSRYSLAQLLLGARMLPVMTVDMRVMCHIIRVIR